MSLSEEIDNAIEKEEYAVPVYNKHLKTAMFWSGLDEEKRKRVDEILKIITNDTLEHIQLFKKIKKLLNK